MGCQLRPAPARFCGTTRPARGTVTPASVLAGGARATPAARRRRGAGRRDGQRDVLPAVRDVGHRRPDGAGREVDRRQLRAVGLVVGDHPGAAVGPAGGQAVDEQRLRQERPVDGVVAAERRQVEVAQQRVVAVAVAVAGRHPPRVLAGVEVDGRHARVGRLDERQPQRHLRLAADGAPAGEALRLRGAVRVGERRAQGRIRLVQGDHRRPVARRDVEHPGLRVDRRPGPARGAARRRAHERAVGDALDPPVERREQRSEAEALDRLEGHPADLRREVDQVVDGHPW